MITNEKAFGYLISFTVFMIFSMFVSRPIWFLVCRSSGKTPAARRVYRKEIRKSENPPKNIYKWLITSSDDPVRTRNLLIKYFLCMLPAFVCFISSVIGLYTHLFDKFFDVAVFVLMLYNVVVLIVGASKVRGILK